MRFGPARASRAADARHRAGFRRRPAQLARHFGRASLARRYATMPRFSRVTIANMSHIYILTPQHIIAIWTSVAPYFPDITVPPRLMHDIEAHDEAERGARL